MLPIPSGIYSTFLDLDPQKLADRGVKLVLADLDNTLVPYGEPLPSQSVIEWNKALQSVGISLFILSNSRRSGRVEKFAEGLDVPYQGWSGKPRRRGYLAAMERMGATPEQTVMVGDQIFTDILGAVRSGVTPLLLTPVTLSGNVGRYLRYHVLEAPFRHLAKGRNFI
ncbi:MAG: YqeG family HAD IIIA-type phosphatase [Eubacteriales bacterium]